MARPVCAKTAGRGTRPVTLVRAAAVGRSGRHRRSTRFAWRGPGIGTPHRSPGAKGKRRRSRGGPGRHHRLDVGRRGRKRLHGRDNAVAGAPRRALAHQRHRSESPRRKPVAPDRSGVPPSRPRSTPRQPNLTANLRFPPSLAFRQLCPPPRLPLPEWTYTICDSCHYIRLWRCESPAEQGIDLLTSTYPTGRLLPGTATSCRTWPSAPPPAAQRGAPHPGRSTRYSRKRSRNADPSSRPRSPSDATRGSRTATGRPRSGADMLTPESPREWIQGSERHPEAPKNQGNP